MKSLIPVSYTHLGEGTVTIRQDPKITGLIGSIYTGNVTGGEQKMLKARRCV